MTDTPYSDNLPTSSIIKDLLAEGERDAKIESLTAELADARRCVRVVVQAAESLDAKSLQAHRRLRNIDPSFASGYEQGMVDAREHVLAAARVAGRNQVIAAVRAQLAEAGLDPDTGR